MTPTRRTAPECRRTSDCSGAPGTTWKLRSLNHLVRAQQQRLRHSHLAGLIRKIAAAPGKCHGRGKVPLRRSCLGCRQEAAWTYQHLCRQAAKNRIALKAAGEFHGFASLLKDVVDRARGRIKKALSRLLEPGRGSRPRTGGTSAEERVLMVANRPRLCKNLEKSGASWQSALPI